MGPAFGFVGHWYYVGGFLGLAIGGVITGILLRLIRGFYDWGRHNESVVVIYPYLLSIGFGEAAATPMGWVTGLPFVLLPLIILLRLCQQTHIRKRKKRGMQDGGELEESRKRNREMERGID